MQHLSSNYYNRCISFISFYLYPAVLPPFGGSSTDAARAAVGWAQAVSLFSLVLWLAGLSFALQTRGNLPWQLGLRSLSSVSWRSAALLAVCLQAVHSQGIAAAAGAPSPFIDANRHWDIWLTVAVVQAALVSVASVVKSRDTRRLAQAMKRARLLFDTRLGQWSPR